MEIPVLVLFCAALGLCLLFNVSILCALGLGLLLFLLYGRRKGLGWRALGRLALSGVKTVKNILITFLLIGILTALWRSAGTIPVLVCYSAALIRPGVFLLMTFLLNCGMSVLTGSAFSTGATAGVVCAAMGVSLGVDIRLIGGAVLAGAYFGDRCSPVSTSALLVAELTGTDIFSNLRRMLHSALIPFLISCAVYGTLGASLAVPGEPLDLWTLFSRQFALHWSALIPATVLLLLSLFRVNVRIAMSVSILTAIPLCLFLQHQAPLELIASALRGFHCADGEVERMLAGGGILSMLRVTGIVCLSSSYSGLFRATGLLDGIKRAILFLSERTTPFFSTLCTAVLTGVVACNQTLTILLTYQLCADLRDDPAGLALDLEDTAAVIPPLIPWSIASGVTLSAVGAPAGSVLFACYLYLLPLWRSITAQVQRQRAGRA